MGCVKDFGDIIMRWVVYFIIFCFCIIPILLYALPNDVIYVNPTMGMIIIMGVLLFLL